MPELKVTPRHLELDARLYCSQHFASALALRIVSTST
jgi:hypothetical protein